jgi:hypothetical protein
LNSLSWYWHRWRAMSPGEVLRHARRKSREWADAGRTAWPEVDLPAANSYPRLPPPEEAPEVVREALRRDAKNILAGRWRFFGHLELQVDDPPRWQFDYLAQRDVATDVSGFKLNYRALGDGVDSKLIWEPSRWHHLVRLAMAAHVLGHRPAAEKCLAWLEDWVRKNPPYQGWNWTSALEVGLRLVQFTWIDALLASAKIVPGETAADSPRSAAADPSLIDPSRLEKLRARILPAHVWYAWRHRSFGSSANNHLLGELAGLIVATVRWPGLARWGAPLEALSAEWRGQVLAQFADDGGNREQALNYQLFSWELCWQALQALRAVQLPPGNIEQALALAARFYYEVQAGQDPWDFGDSDDAFVLPFFAHWENRVGEWHAWFETPEKCRALSYWLGHPPAVATLGKWRRGTGSLLARPIGDWLHYAESGLATAEFGYWFLRWDLSPLGYLKTAAHGHVDALHLSIWRKGVALVIDPGTGAYHANPRLRNWLASREAHNGPCPTSAGAIGPRRRGPFLWCEHHEPPRFELKGALPLASLRMNHLVLRRSIRHLPDVDGWEVADYCEGPAAGEFTVRWQFAPASWVKRHSDRKFSVHRADVAMMIEVDENWARVELVEPLAAPDSPEAPDREGGVDPDGGSARRGAVTSGEADLAVDGLVSPAFRKVVRAPYLKLTARPQGDKPCVFTTTFLASAHS